MSPERISVTSVRKWPAWKLRRALHSHVMPIWVKNLCYAERLRRMQEYRRRA